MQRQRVRRRGCPTIFVLLKRALSLVVKTEVGFVRDFAVAMTAYLGHCLQYKTVLIICQLIFIAYEHGCLKLRFFLPDNSGIFPYFLFPLFYGARTILTPIFFPFYGFNPVRAHNKLPGFLNLQDYDFLFTKSINTRPQTHDSLFFRNFFRCLNQTFRGNLTLQKKKFLT